MDQPAVDPTSFSTIATSEPTKLLHDFLQAHPTVEYIQFQWQDLSGILRARNFTKQYGLELVASKRVRSGPPIALHTTIDSSFLPRVEWAASNWYYPDWSSLKISRSKYAIVMCGIVETTAAIPAPNLDLCPRRALVNILQKAKALQLNLLVGFEVEFIVLKTSPAGDFIPHSRGPGLFAVAGLRDACTSIVEECIHELCESGVQIEGFHTEGRSGQYEIALGPLPPLQAVDQLVRTHDKIKRVFARHGYMATMSPKPISFDERQYNGQHTHISISPPTQEEAFLAGILGRLSAICALGMPYEVSYSRLKPKLGGNVIGWGTEDRDVPIRKIKAGHWEMRNVDATSNMYLTLAAIIAAGLLGIENSEPLKWKDNSIPSVQRTAELCRLPCGLEDALDELEKSSGELGRMMESSILKHYLLVKRSEIGETRKLSPDKLKNLLVEMF